MSYLFFDVECSEGKSICSFGYVLADSMFNVLEKKDILINPQAYFHTGPWSKAAREKDAGIELAYPESEFRRQPNFQVLYSKIKEVICRPDVKVVGFSMDNDARFLNYACIRYHCPFIKFRFYDVQRIYQQLNGLKDQVALEKVIAAYGVDVTEFTQHQSSDDAHITLLIADALCKKENKTLEELVSEYPGAKGESTKYVPKKKKKRTPNYNGTNGSNATAATGTGTEKNNFKSGNGGTKNGYNSGAKTKVGSGADGTRVAETRSDADNYNSRAKANGIKD